MTDAEIIKALECCSQGITIKACENCPINSDDNVINLNFLNLEKSCLDLINRQKAEIERLEKVQVQYVKAYFDEFAERLKNDFRLAELDIGLTSAVVDELVETMNNEFNTLADFTDLIKAEAIREFAERLKKAKQYSLERHENIVAVAVVDWIVKEMVGDT